MKELLHLKEAERPYSKEFLALRERLGDQILLAGSCYERSFADWERERSFLMEAIIPSGKLLDIGCANGLLMKCLKEWSGGSIDPYGVDTNETALAAGRQIFPEFQTHLLTPQGLLATQAGRLSTEYSTVYWNVWDSFALDTVDAKQKINDFLALLSPHGRLVLGFYNPTIEEVQEKIRKLQATYRRPDGIVRAGHGRPETAVFFTTSP